MKDQLADVGRRVAERRRQLGFTQEDLAERARVNLKTVQALEQGRTEPSLRTLGTLAEALSTTLPMLVTSGEDGGEDERGVSVAVLRQARADLGRLPPALLLHVAALVRDMARRSREPKGTIKSPRKS